MDPNYFRPSEVEDLRADAVLAKEILGWEAKITLEELADEMVKSDFLKARRELAASKVISQ